MKFKYKIFLGILLITFTISGATGSYFYFQAKKALYNALKKELITVASITSSFISGDSFKKIKEKRDLTSKEYRDIQKILGKVENSSDDIIYVYTMRLNGSKAVFVVDSPPKDYNNDGKITADEMPLPIGEEYKNPPNSMLMGFVKPSTDKEPIKDESGWTLSGYSPIYDLVGESVGLVGVDMTVQQIEKKIFINKTSRSFIPFNCNHFKSVIKFLFYQKVYPSTKNFAKHLYRYNPW